MPLNVELMELFDGGVVALGEDLGVGAQLVDLVGDRRGLLTLVVDRIGSGGAREYGVAEKRAR